MDAERFCAWSRPLYSRILGQGASVLVQNKQFEVVLGIIQQRLIPSKLQDGWAFDLLQGVAYNVDA
jgi:exportin-2 (importin alpha re-exporter)